MIHRNTMIATDESLLLGDHESCKIIDAETGKIQREIRVTPDLSDGPVWKWMALSDGILYGLVGSTEVEVETQRSNRRGLGHWPWDMWQGHEYNRPEKSFGFGRTFVAIELDSGRNLWTHRTRDFIDARGVCMNDSEIFCYSPGQCLTSINRKTGLPKWRNESVELLSAIGANQKAQHYITGYATTCYLKCNSEHLFFAGPQREQTVVASTADGHVEWTYPMGNLQLVLRDDGVWAAGPQKSESGVKLDYETGKVLSTFPARRVHACHRMLRQHFFPSERWNSASSNRQQFGSAFRSDAATLPRWCSHCRRAFVLGTLDVWLPIITLRKHSFKTSKRIRLPID